jgi:hypothetical protein
MEESDTQTPLGLRRKRNVGPDPAVICKRTSTVGDGIVCRRGADLLRPFVSEFDPEGRSKSKLSSGCTGPHL